MFACARLQASVLVLILISTSYSHFSPAICVCQVCLNVCVEMRRAEWHRAQSYIRGGSSPTPTTTTPLFCRSDPASLVFVASLSPHSPTEARLLFKAALSFGLSTASLSLSFFFFFPLMSTEWLHRDLCLSRTHLI